METTHEIQHRTRRAVGAAVEAGTRVGFRVREPQVLHDAFSVIVHLAPEPVVARVPVVLPPSLDLPALQVRQQRALDAVAWLDTSDHAVIRPTPLAPREPVNVGGFSITLWEHVAVAPDAPDWVSNAGHTAALHASLSRYLADLPLLAPVSHTIPSCLDVLADKDGPLPSADVARARRQWDRLAPIVASAEGFARAFGDVSLQAIHGDAPYYNMVQTSGGPIDADFEDICLGPIEWDLTHAGPDAVRRYDEAAAGLGMRRVNPDALRVMEALRTLQLVSCLALVPQLPALAEWLTPVVDGWRQAPDPAGP